MDIIIQYNDHNNGNSEEKAQTLSTFRAHLPVYAMPTHQIINRIFWLSINDLIIWIAMHKDWSSQCHFLVLKSGPPFLIVVERGGFQPLL